MRLWFGTTTLKFKEYELYYRSIRDYLVEKGHILEEDWIVKNGEYIKKHPDAFRNIKDVYKRVREVIDNANASIIEFTIPNFSSSHQIGYSLQRGKPTLVMMLKKVDTFKDSYLEALDSPLLSITTYSLNNYKDILDEFLGYADLESGLRRYNIMLDRQQKYYLDWACTKYKKSRSELMRDLLDERIKKDPDFVCYISK